MMKQSKIGERGDKGNVLDVLDGFIMGRRQERSRLFVYCAIVLCLGQYCTLHNTHLR